MNKLVMAMLVSLSLLITWFHMQGQFKYEWAKVFVLYLVVYRLVYVFIMEHDGIMNTLTTIGMLDQ